MRIRVESYLRGVECNNPFQFRTKNNVVLNRIQLKRRNFRRFACSSNFGPGPLASRPKRGPCRPKRGQPQGLWGGPKAHELAGQKGGCTNPSTPTSPTPPSYGRRPCPSLSLAPLPPPPLGASPHWCCTSLPLGSIFLLVPNRIAAGFCEGRRGFAGLPFKKERRREIVVSKVLPSTSWFLQG